MALLIGLGLMNGCAVHQIIQYTARRIIREGPRGIRYDAFVAEPLKTNLSQYRRLGVEKLENQMEDAISFELVEGLDRQLLEQLKQQDRLKTGGLNLEVFRSDYFKDNVDSLSPLLAAHPSQSPPVEDADSADSPRVPVSSYLVKSSPGSLIVRPAIVDFHPGDQALRILQMGVGRQAVITLHLWLIDALTEQVMGKLVINSEVYRLPADASSFLNTLSEELTEFLLDILTDSLRETDKKILEEDSSAKGTK